MKQKKKNNNKNNSDSDEDETFYYRYASTSNPTSTTNTNTNTTTTKPNSNSKSNGSGNLAPSKSTVYISNLDFSLTNSDLHTLFSTFGKIARVTVLKDRQTRKSRGVAFVQFVARQDALSAAREMHQKILNGRTLSASIAEDNGRAPEFIKKRIYKDKSRCYECGVEGHLSYECPKNQLGARERPVEKRVRRVGGGGGGKRDGGGGDGEEEGGSDGGDGVGFEDENWASVVDSGADERLLKGGEKEEEEEEGVVGRRKKMKKASYFSDESDEED